MADSWAGTGGCDLCGSTRFRIIDGITYCAEGHEQAGGQQIANDADEYGTQGKLTIARRDKSRVKTSRIYRGHKAYKLFLQAYQLIVWKQCHALIHQKGLPPELWTVVKDLWTLRLAKQADKLEKLSPLDIESQNQSTEAETGDERENDTLNMPGSSEKSAHNSPTLVETIALCHLGIMLMRLPTGLADIYRWIRTEDIPYFRAIRHVPPPMKAHLPGEYERALDTEVMLRPDVLQTAVFRLCALYTTEFGMSVPAINSSLLLFQYIKRLALPLEIYPTVKNLNKIVEFSFTYSLVSDSRPRRNATSHPEAQLISLVVVATKLIFPFDSDVVKRHPRSLNEPAAQRINWKKWVELRKQGTATVGTTGGDILADEGRSGLALEKGREAEITDRDVLKMSGPETDQYMDWYQRTWTKPDNAEDNVNKELLDMFPLNALPAENHRQDPEYEIEEAQLRAVREAHAAMKLNRPISGEVAGQLQLDSEVPVEINRPGSHYLMYRKFEDLSGAARAFYEAAAEVACMSVERLVKAVLQTEAKIETWRKERRRAERFGGTGEEGEEGEERGEGQDRDMEMSG